MTTLQQVNSNAGTSCALKQKSISQNSRLQEETGILLKKREKLQKKLNKHTSFHEYLEKAVSGAEEFQEIREVIDRYDTLTATHEVQIFWE